jgi:hypothetical protein
MYIPNETECGGFVACPRTISVNDRKGQNRETWSAIKRILEFVGSVVNPVFRVFWDSRWKTVPCPAGQPLG